ncbi:MAG: sensor histidine kinase KdpD [Clostridia bacterium]|nr:sensor histidine kinase KdpD [Clostridia bacterium]
MEAERRDPEQLLKAIQLEEDSPKRGKLKIFFGYAAGVGKTYSMLKAAHAAAEKGIDVAAGYIEPHDRPNTSALVNGLECIPNLVVEYNNIKLKEFNLDEALKRKPQLILVDELAHTNACGCRHNKRYQDVEELLNAGIDVYSTVNVQHIESLNDTVAAITGISVKERIPDSVFDNADQVELVDIEPVDLLERMKAGNIYKKQQSKFALENFFNIENLISLREIALRRCADRVNRLSESARIKRNGDYYTDEHILVCLSSSPSNAKIIRTAARMANAFHGKFTALFIETPDFEEMSDENKKRLKSNTDLAKDLGARIENIHGDDIPLLISEFARLSGVSKIVLGRSGVRGKGLFNNSGLSDKLIQYAPNIDIYIIPDGNYQNIYYKRKRREKINTQLSIKDTLKSVGLIGAATLISMVFYGLGFSEVNIITVYILFVLIISVVTERRLYSLISSAVCVIVFNFLFTDPKFTLLAYDKGYPVTFATMFIAAFITGSLAAKLKNSAKQSAYAAYRTKILFDTSQIIEHAGEKNEIINATANQLCKLLNRSIIIYSAEKGELGDYQFCSVKDNENLYISETEKAVASWVLKNNKRAGATTDTLSSADYLYMAIRVNECVYGVAGIKMENKQLDSFERNILVSILGECALALENEKNAKEKEKAAVIAQQEQLRANLLRAISHDLRTPLTSISGNASNLMSNSKKFDDETKIKLYTDIYDDSMWLINLVENLLSITRIEDGHMNLKVSSELMDDVVNEALRHINRKSVAHKIKVKSSEEFIFAKIDPRLIIQVIINIVDNAIKYTPENSEITISVCKRGNDVVVSIADNGNGIPDESKKHVFDMFYTGTSNIADSRRSLGLGLALCKSIIDAHGGVISVSDNEPNGTIFTFTLPAEEVELYE